MASRKRAPRQSGALCGSVHEDDGIDPRDFFRGGSRKTTDRKTFQLCAQVKETLGVVLAGESDEVLCGLLVASVTRAAGANRLTVTLELPPGAGKTAAAKTLEHVHRAAGRLRTAVAAAVCRRRVPELEFRIGPPAEVEP
jgi:ribosome-binding factor A